MSAQPTELYSLLIPLQGEKLLAPRACVAEVIAFIEPERSDEKGQYPAWYVGRVDWSGRRLPVVSFEGMSGEETKKRAGRSRIVVFHALGEEFPGGHYGVITQGFPQLVRVNADVLSADLERPWPEEQPALCRAHMINEFPLIPDMERLEAMLLEVIS